MRGGLTPEARSATGGPSRAAESRWPTLEWPRQIPIENVPPGVHDIVDPYGRWLRSSPVPKLFIDADPGHAGRPEARARPEVAGADRGAGARAHFVPEDSPHEIGRALADWLRTLP